MNPIRIKRSDVVGNKPPVLAFGETAINTADKVLYVGDNASNVIELSGMHTAQLIDRKPLGTNGGTNRKKVWNVRALNTIVYDSLGIVQIIGDDFKLVKGTYFIQISAPVNEVGLHKLRIWNEVTNTLVAEGQNAKSKKSSFAQLSCIINTDGTDLFELQHYTEEREKRYGLGIASNLGSYECYTIITIFKVL